MKRFVADAKRYGVVYCALRNTKDNPSGECEIMVRAEDAAKINRIVENIKALSRAARSAEPTALPRCICYLILK